VVNLEEVRMSAQGSTLVLKSLDDQVRDNILQKSAQMDLKDPKVVKAAAEFMKAFCSMVDTNKKWDFKDRELNLEERKFEWKKVMDERRTAVYENRFTKNDVKEKKDEARVSDRME
jgi:hypothetical protein